jgi:hypothetical protein
MIQDFASDILYAIRNLQDNKYVVAPGEINFNNVYFNQMYDEALLDPGRNLRSISTEWLLQHSQALLKNRKYDLLLTYSNKVNFPNIINK